MGRILDYPEKPSPGLNDYLLVDSSSEGTKKISASNIVTVDSSLTQPGQPADAKKTGDEITSLKNQIPTVDSTLTQPGQAADAKVVGDEIGDLKADLNDVINSESVMPINLLNLNDSGFASGTKLSASTGNPVPVASANNNTTGFIPVEEGKTYNWVYGSNLNQSQSMSRMCAYNSSKTYLSTYTADNIRGFTVPINSGIRFIRFSGIVTQFANEKQMFTEGFPTNYEEYTEPYIKREVKNTALDSLNIMDLGGEKNRVYTEWEHGSYDYSWGFVEGNTHVISDYIPVGELLTVTVPSGYTALVYPFSMSGLRLTTYPYSVSGGTVEVKKTDASYVQIVYSANTATEIADPQIFGLGCEIVRYGKPDALIAIMTAEPNAKDVVVSNVMPQYLVLVAVKERNELNKMPVTVGYLYRTVTAPYKLYYAQGKPDNIKYLCDWNTSLAGTSNNTPIWYCFGITNEGDIICVHRGEIEEPSSDRVRDNPIVYPHTDYANPVLVELTGTKPTSWISNSGDFAEEGHFWFGEYIRSGHTHAYVWDVTAPYTEPSNWTIAKTYERDTNPSDPSTFEAGKIEHIHHVSRDPFSGILYVTTGDHWTEARIDYLNNGTWGVLRAGDEEVCRQLNFIYTPTYVYWGSDAFAIYDPDTQQLVAGAHKFFRATRDANGFIDLDNLDVIPIPRLTGSVATYHTCYVKEPECILVLDRKDESASYAELPFHVWNIKKERFELAGQFKMAKGNSIAQYLGFRTECCQHYPNFYDSALSVGFSLYPNSIAVCGNLRPEIIPSQGGNTGTDTVNTNQVNSMKVIVEKY